MTLQISLYLDLITLEENISLEIIDGFIYDVLVITTFKKVGKGHQPNKHKANKKLSYHTKQRTMYMHFITHKQETRKTYIPVHVAYFV